MRRWRPAALMLVAMLSLGACDTSDVQLARDFIIQWATDHAGEIAAHRGGALTSWLVEKDPNQDYVDAAVDGYDVVSNLQEADKLMAKGRQNSDPVAMDAALTRRPDDWSYQLSRADLALQMDDMTSYWGHRNQVQIHSIGVPWQQIDKQQYSELLAVHKRLDRGPGKVSGYTSYQQCRALYDALAVTSGNLGGDPTSTEALSWRKREADCNAMPH